MVLTKKQFGGIADLSQARLLHLVDAELRGAAETVLYGAQDAVHVVLVALKLYDRVDDMFQNLRTGKRALLINMSDKDDGYACRLGEME